MSMSHPTKPRAIVVDLDNTLALVNGKRSYFDGHLCDTDDLCPATAFIVRMIATHDPGVLVILLTSRNERARGATMSWLMRHGIMFDQLLMREVTDWTPATDYKTLSMRDILSRMDVIFAIDDDPLVVDAFRSMGVTTFHVRPHEHHNRRTHEDVSTGTTR